MTRRGDRKSDLVLGEAEAYKVAAYLLATIALSYWTHWTVGVAIWAVLLYLSFLSVRRKANGEGKNAS